MIEVIDYESKEKIELTEEQFEAQKQELLMSWQEAKKTIEEQAKKEKDAKLRFVCLTGNPGRTKGSEYVPLPNGWRCKITKNVNYSFIKAFETEKIDMDSLTTALSEIAANVQNGHEIASNLVSWNPKLSISEYNNLPDDARKIIDRVIVTKPASPSLEIMEPKG